MIAPRFYPRLILPEGVNNHYFFLWLNLAILGDPHLCFLLKLRLSFN